MVVVGWSVGQYNSQLVELDVINPVEHQKHVSSLKSAPAASEMADTLQRAIKAHQCWLDNGHAKGRYRFILKQDNGESATAFVSRVIAARKLAEPAGDHHASGVITGFLPHAAMPQFVATTDAGELNYLLNADETRTDYPDRPNGRCYQEIVNAGRYRFEPFGIDLRIFDAGMHSATASEYRRAFERTPANATPGARKSLQQVMDMWGCMEANGLLYSAKNWHFVVYDFSAGKANK